MATVLVLGFLAFLVFVLVNRKSKPAQPRADLEDYGVSLSVTHVFGTTSAEALNEKLPFIATDTPFVHGSWAFPNPLFYVTKKSSFEYPEASLIELSLPVAKRNAAVGDLGYWPTFRGMDAAQRRYYFDWLAGGRHDPDVPIGYVFVFFYGLERRLLVEQQDEHKIIGELNRLLDLYGHQRSFRSYASRLLAFWASKRITNMSEATIHDSFPTPALGRYMEEDALAAAVGWYADLKRPLPVSYAMAIAASDPRAQRSVVLTKTADEFTQLFAAKYKDEFGQGLIPEAGARKLKTAYHPGSPTLVQAQDRVASLTVTMTNGLGRRSQFKPLAKMWNASVEGLKSYSRAKGKTEALSPDAWSKLPPELQAETPHPETVKWEKLIDSHLDDDGHVHLPAGILGEMRGFEPRSKFTMKQCQDLCKTAGDLDLGLVPDPRITRSAWGWRETIAIFRDAEAGSHLKATSKYPEASLVLRLGMAIAEADGHVDSEEVETITDFLEGMFTMNESEKQRLEVLARLLEETGSPTRGLVKKIESALTIKHVRQIGKLLVAVAAADGVIDKSEIKVLRKLYKSLGMDEDALNEAIEQMQGGSRGQPVPVRAAKASKGEAIPARRASEEERIEIDRGAVAVVLRETKGAAELLHGIFGETGEDDSAVEVVSGEPAGPTLDASHQSFMKELVKKDEWNVDELEGLAHQHNLMPSGALDVINEWAMEQYSDLLIQGDGPYEVDKTLLARE